MAVHLHLQQQLACQKKPYKILKNSPFLNAKRALYFAKKRLITCSVSLCFKIISFLILVNNTPSNLEAFTYCLQTT